MNDDFINQFGKPRPPRRAFAASLYKRINEPMQTPARTPLFRMLAITLTVLTVLVAALFVLPPARAFADGVIRRMGFFIFVQGEVQPDPTKQALRDQGSEKPVVEKERSQANPQGKVDTLEEGSVNDKKELPGASDAAAASQLAGFPVLTPAYLPDGYTSISGWTVEKKGELIQAVNIGYKNAAHEVLMISQAQSDENTPPHTYTLPDIYDVTVRGLPGVWLPEGKRSLVWVENGITLTIASSALSLEETQKIAESLGK